MQKLKREDEVIVIAGKDKGTRKANNDDRCAADCAGPTGMQQEQGDCDGQRHELNKWLGILELVAGAKRRQGQGQGS